MLVATTAIHDGPHRGLVRQANHSADETTQRYPANPRVIRGYGYHLSGPSLLVSTHPSLPTDYGVSTNACLALSIDAPPTATHRRSKRVSMISRHCPPSRWASLIPPKPTSVTRWSKNAEVPVGPAPSHQQHLHIRPFTEGSGDHSRRSSCVVRSRTGKKQCQSPREHGVVSSATLRQRGRQL